MLAGPDPKRPRTGLGMTTWYLGDTFTCCTVFITDQGDIITANISVPGVGPHPRPFPDSPMAAALARPAPWRTMGIASW